MPIFLISVLAGCSEPLNEGTGPGDCTDRADNDGDGLFDCDDDGCESSPDCTGSGSDDSGNDDTSTDSGGDSGTEPKVGDRQFLGVGAWHTCAGDSAGVVTCWGQNFKGSTEPPEGVVFTRISSGSFQNCGLDDSGAIRCWGATRDGEDTPAEGTFIDLGIGTAHGCALSVSHTIACWGNNEQEQQEIPSW